MGKDEIMLEMKRLVRFLRLHRNYGNCEGCDAYQKAFGRLGELTEKLLEDASL